jgi:DNA-binding transcriptional regulator YdaS (Cro superfamily)
MGIPLTFLMGMPIISFMDFNELIAYYGTQQKAADAIGIHQSSVAEWKTNGIPIPRQYQIQVLTDGKLKASQGKR